MLQLAQAGSKPSNLAMGHTKTSAGPHNHNKAVNHVNLLNNLVLGQATVWLSQTLSDLASWAWNTLQLDYQVVLAAMSIVPYQMPCFQLTSLYITASLTCILTWGAGKRWSIHCSLQMITITKTKSISKIFWEFETSLKSLKGNLWVILKDNLWVIFKEFRESFWNHFSSELDCFSNHLLGHVTPV